VAASENAAMIATMEQHKMWTESIVSVGKPLAGGALEAGAVAEERDERDRGRAPGDR